MLDYICPKCKCKYTGDKLEFCICGTKLQPALSYPFDDIYQDIFKNWPDLKNWNNSGGSKK